MQGLELSRSYYETFGKQMIHELFPEYEKRIAVGLAGPGSDCFGYDDDTSRDHDFGAGFCVWLTDEDYDLFGHELARAYGRLPNFHEGFKKADAPLYGTGKYGVKRISDFFRPLTGLDGAPDSVMQWLYTPEHTLACAVNGDVFRDDLGVFSGIRNKILLDMPEDVRLKKIAFRTVMMAQSGQYNFSRCISHGEYGAASIALSEFAKHTAALAFILNGKYCPFYKWAIRGMKDLDDFSYMSGILDEVLTENVVFNHRTIADKIEIICGDFAEHFRTTRLSDSKETFLEPHAYSIQNKIKNSELRLMHIMDC